MVPEHWSPTWAAISTGKLGQPGWPLDLASGWWADKGFGPLPVLGVWTVVPAGLVTPTDLGAGLRGGAECAWLLELRRFGFRRWLGCVRLKYVPRSEWISRCPYFSCGGIVD